MWMLNFYTHYFFKLIKRNGSSFSIYKNDFFFDFFKPVDNYSRGFLLRTSSSLDKIKDMRLIKYKKFGFLSFMEKEVRLIFSFLLKNTKNMFLFYSFKNSKFNETLFLTKINYVFLSFHTSNYYEMRIFFWFLKKKRKIVCFVDKYVLPSFFKVIIFSKTPFYPLSSFLPNYSGITYVFYLYFNMKKFMLICFCSSVVEH